MKTALQFEEVDSGETTGHENCVPSWWMNFEPPPRRDDSTWMRTPLQIETDMTLSRSQKVWANSSKVSSFGLPDVFM